MKNHLVKILLLVMLLATQQEGLANGFSYVYIQGDKSTPFYVKFEDQMLPRYGKNYCIIPQLIPGPINIQILFQQNSYPPQKFTIVVPDNGFRGFLLMQKGGVFSLYDIQQQFYLNPGNKAEDDKVVAANSGSAYITTNAAASTPLNNADRQRPVVSQPKVNQQANTTGTLPTNKQAKGVSPKFLPNIELSSDHQPQNSSPQKTNIASETAYEEAVENDEDSKPESLESQIQEAPVVHNTLTSMINSDCPGPVNEREFEDLQDKVLDRTEKTRLKFLLTKVTECYTARHAKVLAETLNNDPERYTFLKKIYPRVTDQQNFPVLESLLTTQEWKSYFKLILPK